MLFTYKVQLVESNKVLNVDMNFTPYANLTSNWSVLTGWVSTTTTIALDEHRKIFREPMINFTLNSNVDDGGAYKDLPCEQNKNYLISCYVRNNGIMTTGLRVDNQVDYSPNYFTNRLLVKVASGSRTSIRVNLDFFQASDYIANAWVGGFLMSEITNEEMLLPIDELSLKYPYVKIAKESPSMKDLLRTKYHGSPFMYFMTMDGIKIPNYNTPLAQYGVTSDTLLATYFNEIPNQIWATFTDSVALMTMLEGDAMRVSHSYPKMDYTVEDLRLFPRVQYFEGFELSTMRSDGKPLANNTTLYINIYVPSTKVMNSMQDSMISTVVTFLMGELGFSAIRGSDYFREPEQLYVRQVQYIKDVPIIKKVKT